jgi:hypothetical protein
MTDKASVILGGTVEKIIESPGQPDMAEIAIDGTGELYSEIRIENSMTDQDGDEVLLKKGAEVEVTIEVNTPSATPKP